MIDSLRYLRSLEEVGYSRSQSEVQLNMMVELMRENVASKDDLRNLREDVSQSLVLLKTEFAKISVDFERLRGDVKNLEYRLMFRLGGLMTALFAIGISIGSFLLQRR